MRRTIVILSVFVLLASGCNRATTSQAVANTENMLVVDSAEMQNENESLDTLSLGFLIMNFPDKNFQENTIWISSDAGTAYFVRFQPDALLPDTNFFDADLIGFDIPFRVSDAYRVGDLRLLFGHDTDGQSSEVDWGLRLLAFNAKNQLVFRSRGSLDSFIFIPHFFMSSDSNHVLILCRMGDCGGHLGAAVFLVDMETSEIFRIGHINEPYDVNELSGSPVTNIVTIQRVGNTLVFSFPTYLTVACRDSFRDGVVEDNIKIYHKYVFSEGERTRVDLHTLHSD